MPPRLARLLAVVAAVGLVAGAFAVRSAIAGDDTDPVGEEPDGDDPSTGSYVLACDEDLGAACDTLADELGGDRVAVVRAADVLATEDPTWDAWLTLDPLPAILDEKRSFAGHEAATSGDPVMVASSVLALLTREDGGVDCDGDWLCVTAAADVQSVGVPRLTSASGMVVAGAAYADLGGPAVEQQGIAALDEGDIRARLTDLTDLTGDLLDQSTLIVTQRGSFDGIVTTEGLASRRIESRPDEGLRSVAIDPGVTVGVVLVGLGEDGTAAAAALAETVTGKTVGTALAEAGWDGEGAASTGLPEPDVIDALRERLG